MKDLSMRLGKIENFMASDKALHFLWMFFFQILICTKFEINIFVYLIPILIAVVKELYDLKIKKTYISLLDILATVLGGYCAIGLYIIINS